MKTLKQQIAMLLAGVFAMMCITNTVAGQSPAPVRVACIGDSITASWPDGQDYPAQLQKLLGTNWNVRNFGVSARTLLRKGDFPYWRENAFTNAQAFQPDVVVILLGANDSKPQNWKYHDDFAGDYTGLVNTFRDLSSKPRIYVCRPTPVPEPGNYGINQAVELEQAKIIDSLANTMKLAEIDLYTPLKDQPQLLPDRVHPNAEGNAVIAGVVYQALTGKAFSIGAASAAPIRVACVGDSITFGAGTDPGMSYPSQLQAMLGEKWEVKNFGVPARTLLKKGIHPYWIEKAFADAQDYNPDIVIILLGTNDADPKNWIHQDEFSSDYRKMVETFQALPSKPRVFVCRPTPTPDQAADATIKIEIQKINALAQEMKLDVIDMHAALESKLELLPDACHPNTAGARIMAETAYQALTGKRYVEIPVIQHSTWYERKVDEFVLAGHKCKLVKPLNYAPGKPWIWRPEFFGAYDQADNVLLLQKGFPIAYMDMENIFGSPPAMELMDRFYDFLTTHYGLSPKTTLFGFSRGGLYSLNWAARHPERVACIYLDAPVCDFKSWPAGFGKGSGSPGDWSRLKQFYGFKNDQEARDYKLNPIDNLKPLADAKIPILSVCGDADKTVPYLENTAILQERYQALGGSIQVIVKPGCDHHPHSLTNPAPIVDFVLKYN
jgi:lysophospholipase L1-like esterase/pimeloyl-ACP methyl ester carboxylesterase